MSVNLKIRNIFQFAFSLLLMAGLSSCIMDTGFDEPGEMTSATLRLSTRSSVTRADGKDELEKDPYAENEDKIGRVALFFYTDGKSTSAPFFVTELNVEEIVSADVVVKIPEELVTGSNFPGNKAYAYALANLPADVRIDAADGKISVGSGAPKAATLEALQALWVGNPGFVSASAPATFVMRGGGEIALQEDATGARTASGTILLERLASKIRLWADIPGYLYIDKTTGKTIDENASDFQAKKDNDKIEKWESVPVSGDESNVNLYLYNLTQRGRIDGYVGACIDDPEDPEDLAYANIENAAKGARKIAENVRLNDADKDETYTYSHEAAYYSYPNVWDGDSPSEQHRTHVVISVPWRRVEGGDTEYRECYYSVPVNALTATTDNGKAEKANCLEPNCYYRIKVRIGMLGNTNRGEAIEIPASYEVVPWSTANVDVNIKDRRFLVVNQKEWVMNNTYTLEIPFATSHKTEVVACYVNYFRYNDVWGNDDNANANASFTSSQIKDPKLYHDKEEFKNWLTAADKPVANGGCDGRNNEGEVWAKVNNSDSYETMLYYKKKYFYDDIYKNYTYYVGHEHPKTFQHNHITFAESVANGLTEDTKNSLTSDWSAWERYNEKYNKINAIYTCEIDHDRSVINFSHPLVQWKEVRVGSSLYYAPELNPRTNELWDEFSRVEIIVKIKHEDWDSSIDHLYEETIYITQYPGMYVEVSHDYGDAAGSAGGNSTDPKVSQYVIVNGQRTPYANAGGSDEPPYLVSYTPLPNFYGSNNNPNMYVIYTTQLTGEDGQLYEIGDPRTLYSDNNLKPNRNMSAPYSDQLVVTTDINDVQRWEGSGYQYYTPPSWLGGGYSSVPYGIDLHNAVNVVSKASNVKLTNYYPADETTGSGSKENFIAPAFRIASSFGKVAVGYRVEARRRCAVYQEAGRPAGRWRLPTKAEIKYIARLSADGKIPILLGDNSDPELYGEYWSAQGGLLVNGKGEVKDSDAGQLNVIGVFAPRCIYDEWYWTQIDGGEFPVDPNSPTGARLSPITTTFYWGDVKKDNTQELPKP